MEQRRTAVTTTEFAWDAVELLAHAVRHAAERPSPAVGTEHLLVALLGDTEEPGAALVPGGRESGAIRGQIRARDEQNWARDDAGDEGVGAVPEDDEVEVTAVWREALWSANRSRREDAAPAPRPSEALRRTLLGALRLAREEGAPDAHERHLARALLDVRESRALEALSLRRVDMAASAAALDAQVEAVRAGGEPWPAEAAGARGAVRVLRSAGLLGERGVWWTRGMMTWLARTSGDGSPVVLVLCNEAQRQSVRHGRTETEPVDLLLAVLALDRGLTVAGLSLPEDLLPVNSAADALRSAGVHESDLFRAAAAAAGPSPQAAVPSGPKRSVATDKTVAAARLLAADRKDRTVGTTHILTALLATGDDATTALLTENGVNPELLRTRLEATAGAA